MKRLFKSSTDKTFSETATAVGLAEWLMSSQGNYVRNWEQNQLDPVLADIFGFNAVQFGLPEVDYLRANRMSWKLIAAPLAGGGVYCRADALPFAVSSVDLVLLPHVLEFTTNPHQVLREAARVLVPGGSVVITGFNPISLWGVRRYLASRSAQIPWRGIYLSVHRLKDWLTLLDLEPQCGAFGCYAPALSQDFDPKSFSLLERMGDRWWPVFGGVYYIQAVKRVAGMHLIMPRWKERMAQAMDLIPRPAAPGRTQGSTNKL